MSQVAKEPLKKRTLKGTVPEAWPVMFQTVPLLQVRDEGSVQARRGPDKHDLWLWPARRGIGPKGCRPFKEKREWEREDVRTTFFCWKLL